MHLLLILVPAAAAGICLLTPYARLRLAVVLGGAAGHLGITIWTWQPGVEGGPLYFFALDPLAHLFVTLISVLFLATSVYFVGSC